MGRDKTRLRLDGKTLLQNVQAIAGHIPWSTRIIRRDAVPRCGPLGGIVTALTSTRAEAILFLACDMPFVPADWLECVIGELMPKTQAVFTYIDRRAGFPFVLRTSVLPIVERHIVEKRFSLQALAEDCGAKRIAPPTRIKKMFLNINTPEDWQSALQLEKKFQAGLSSKAKSDTFPAC